MRMFCGPFSQTSWAWCLESTSNDRMLSLTGIGFRAHVPFFRQRDLQPQLRLNSDAPPRGADGDKGRETDFRDFDIDPSTGDLLPRWTLDQCLLC